MAMSASGSGQVTVLRPYTGDQFRGLAIRARVSIPACSR